LNGALSSVRADDLAAIPIKALVDRNAGVDWAAIDHTIFGCANQAGEGGAAAPHSLADGEKLLEGTDVLAGAFRRAGAGPTAATMSLVCLVVAAIAAGVKKF
jgi:acetyl-CoA acetyltransferase